MTDEALTEYDSIFCANTGCVLHVRPGDPNVRGSGNWAEFQDGTIVGRRRVCAIARVMSLALAGVGWHAVIYGEEARIHRRNDRCSPLDAGHREKAGETPPASDGGVETI